MTRNGFRTGIARCVVVCSIVLMAAGTFAARETVNDFEGTDVSSGNTEWFVGNHVSTVVDTATGTAFAGFDPRSVSVSRPAATAGFDSVEKTSAETGVLSRFRSSRIGTILLFR